MTPEQKAAFINSQTLCALSEVLGMMADNTRSILQKQPPQYNKDHFTGVIERYALDHNSVVSFFHPDN